MLPVLSHCTRSDIIFDFPFPYSIKFTQTAKNSQFPTKKYERERNEQQTSKNQIKYTFASFFKIKWRKMAFRFITFVIDRSKSNEYAKKREENVNLSAECAIIIDG